MADPFPEPGEDDLVRVLERGGSAFYCPDELALRMEMAAEMLEASAPEALYAAAVPAAARAIAAPSQAGRPGGGGTACSAASASPAAA